MRRQTIWPFDQLNDNSYLTIAAEARKLVVTLSNKSSVLAVPASRLARIDPPSFHAIGVLQASSLKNCSPGQLRAVSVIKVGAVDRISLFNAQAWYCCG
jgi:hypothetical protein